MSPKFQSLKKFFLFSLFFLPLLLLLIFFADRPLALFIKDHKHFFYPFFEEFTRIADKIFTHAQPFLLLAIAYLISRFGFKNKKMSSCLGVTFFAHLFSTMTSNHLKMYFQRLRPEKFFENPNTAVDFQAYLPPFSDSFPSGHVAAYLSLFLPLALYYPKWRWPLLSVPLLIALGRLLLCQHYLGDVLASVYLTATICFFLKLGVNWLEGKAKAEKA